MPVRMELCSVVQAVLIFDEFIALEVNGWYFFVEELMLEYCLKNLLSIVRAKKVQLTAFNLK